MILLPRFSCVPLEDKQELLILVHVKYLEGESSSFGANWKSENCKYRLNVYLFDTSLGYRPISQPLLADYSHEAVHVVQRDDRVLVVGRLKNSREVIGQVYEIGLDKWSFVEKVEAGDVEEGFVYTQFYEVDSGLSFK